MGPGIPVPPLSAPSTSWARSLSLSTSPQPLSLPLSRGSRTPSLTPVLRQRSAQVWMLLVKGLRVSKGLSATWVGKESGKGPEAVLAHPLQALSRPHRPALPLPPPSGCVCPHTHLGRSEASLNGPAFMRGREMPALHGGCQHHSVQKRACTCTHPRANTHARVHTLTHAQGLGIPQMLVFVAASSVILSPWDFS